jgi:acetyl esterase/lipase
LKNPIAPPVSILLAGLALSSAAGPLAASEPGFRVISDVPFLAPGRAEKLDVYLPDGSGTTPRAAVVYFHGGGWVKGDKATEREKEIGGALAAAGYVFVTANYKLGDRVWPTNLEDCLDAVRFTRSHAAEYNVDPGRIAAMGTSAGAHLALLVAYADEKAGSPTGGPYQGVSSRVRAVIEMYGITDLLTRRNVNSDGTPKDTLDNAHSVGMLGVGRREGAALWREASPVSHVSASVPPTLIVHGLADPIVDHAQATELADALQANGVEHEVLFLKGVGHMFDLEYTSDHKPLPQDLRPVVLGFLAKHL